MRFINLPERSLLVSEAVFMCNGREHLYFLTKEIHFGRFQSSHPLQPKDFGIAGVA